MSLNSPEHCSLLFQPPIWQEQEISIMKSRPTPHTHTAVTSEEIRTTFGATGGPQWPVTVPAGTRCRKLEGGSNPWVVSDLEFIGDKQSMLYWDADHYGIRIAEEKLTDIRAVEKRVVCRCH
jgi:hypothetical protein